MTDNPNPGSDAAMEAGCTCPIMDNGGGERIGKARGFWYTAGCPVHDPDENKEINMAMIDVGLRECEVCDRPLNLNNYV